MILKQSFEDASVRVSLARFFLWTCSDHFRCDRQAAGRLCDREAVNRLRNREAVNAPGGSRISPRHGRIAAALDSLWLGGFPLYARGHKGSSHEAVLGSVRTCVRGDLFDSRMQRLRQHVSGQYWRSSDFDVAQ